jgi:hypothetical protein
MRSRHARELFVVALIAAVITIAVTWPIAGRFGSAGRIDTGDGRYSIWNVAWVANALTTNPATLWDANIFFPYNNSLAFSEANVVAGILAAPIWVATKNPYAASNFAILCSFVLAAVAMYALVLHLTRSRAAAALAALHYAFSAYAFAHIPHIQLLMTFGPPLAMLRLHKFVEAPTIRTSVWLGVAVALQALACGYYGMYGGIAVALGVIWFGVWEGHWRAPRYWMLAAAAGAIAFAVVAPFLIPYFDIRADGFTRTLEDARMFRAEWTSYLASGLILNQWILPFLGSWREVLFPGYLPVIFTVVAIVHVMRRRAPAMLAGRAHLLGFYLLLAGFAMWASFGPDAGLYRWLYETVPLMSLLRAPARFGLLVTLALAVAGAIGFAGFEARLTTRRRLVITGILAFALARSTAGPLELFSAPPALRAHEWLRTAPRSAVVEFPYFIGNVRSQNTSYMLQSTTHWQPLLNGYSDFIPEGAFSDGRTLSKFPSAESWQVLRARQAKYVVIHWEKYPPGLRPRLMEDTGKLWPYMRPILRDDHASLYEIVAWPADTTAVELLLSDNAPPVINEPRQTGSHNVALASNVAAGEAVEGKRPKVETGVASRDEIPKNPATRR